MKTKRNEFSSSWDNASEFVQEYFLFLGTEIVNFAIGDSPDMTKKLLCWQLFNTEFYYANKFDESRIHEALSLRELFLEREYGLMPGDDRLSPIEEHFMNTPMSVLEIMAGMAHWCEERITYVHGEDKRDIWFEAMLHNLGFDGIRDDNFTSEIADLVDRNIHIAMNHSDDINIGFWTTEKRKQSRYWKADLWGMMNQWLIENYY